ncbi:MAG: gliding motility-associated C-terminal domain-containing protein [Bacteroidota bacterium]
MKKTTAIFIVLLFFCLGSVQAQTNILVYSETFETGAPGVMLNTAGVGTNTGSNVWVINDSYIGTPTYPNTVDQSVTSGGTISFAPNSKYLHIYDQSSGITNCNYNPTAASDHFVQLTGGFCTRGMSDVKLTFFYICQGSPTAYMDIYYSVDNGPWVSTGTQYSNQSVWQYTIVQNLAFNNVNNLRFAYRWVNDAGTAPGAMSVGIDDIFITGFFDNFVTNFNVVLDSVTPNPICQNFGLLIYYHLPVPICGNGFYEVQLSNSTGSFASPTILALYQGSNSFLNGALWPTIPSATTPGTCYKVRIHYYYTDYALNFYSNASPCFEVQLCPNTINTLQPTVTMSSDSLCIGSVIDVPFYSTGVFLTGNHYTAQLSDSTGSFSGNLNILGSIPSTKTYDPALGSSPGSVSGMVLETTQAIPDGCNYYVRVVSTNPVAVGLQWGPFCIKHCDIETNHKLDIHACLSSTQGFDTTVYVNIHKYDSSATAAIYEPDSNQYKLEVHSSMNFAVIPPLGGLGSITATNDTTLHIHIPNANLLGTLGLSPGLYYLRVVATHSNHPWDANGTIIRLLIGAPADNLWILQSPPDSILCVGDAVFFYPIPYNVGPPMNSTYQWYLNGPLFSTEAAVGILFNGAGTYNLTVRETNYGCPGPLTPNSVSLDVLAPPSANFLGPLQVCLGDTIYYHIAFHPNIYYEWTKSGGTIIDTSNNELYIRFDTAGVYTIDLLCLNKCGQAIGHKSVIVTEHPDPTFTTLPMAACTGDSILINYSGTSVDPLTYNWNFGGGTAVPGGNLPGPHHVSWTVPGSHQVLLDISQYSCHTKDSTLINVIQKPKAVFTAANVCFGTVVIFADSSQGSPASYLWSFGDGTTLPNVSNPTHLYADTGNYIIKLMVANGFCIDSLSQLLEVSMVPTSTFTATDSICLSGTSLVTYTGNARPDANYLWNFSGANVLSGSGMGPYVLSWTNTGSYNITLFVTQKICISDTTSDTVLVKTCELVIPNVITPNNDSKNDVLHITGLETFPQTEIIIYNRWGKVVYQNSDYKNNWDGGDCPDGVYYYVLIPKNHANYHGTVTIFR